MTSIKENDTS